MYLNKINGDLDIFEQLDLAFPQCLNVPNNITTHFADCRQHFTYISRGVLFISKPSFMLFGAATLSFFRINRFFKMI